MPSSTAAATAVAAALLPRPVADLAVVPVGAAGLATPCRRLPAASRLGPFPPLGLAAPVLRLRGPVRQSPSRGLPLLGLLLVPVLVAVAACRLAGARTQRAAAAEALVLIGPSPCLATLAMPVWGRCPAAWPAQSGAPCTHSLRVAAGCPLAPAALRGAPAPLLHAASAGAAPALPLRLLSTVRKSLLHSFAHRLLPSLRLLSLMPGSFGCSLVMSCS